MASEDGGPKTYDKMIPTEHAQGFRKRCEFHLSYEAEKRRCGKAVYRIVDPDGTDTPIYKRYDTHPSEGYNEYAVEGHDGGFKKWSDAASTWNAMLAARKEATDGNRD